jgi:AICAR transformylase/IMP cyclohydrolase PurH
MRGTYEEVKALQEKIRKITGGTLEQQKEREAFFSKPRISIVTHVKGQKKEQKD